jgi:hypothetical protein
MAYDQVKQAELFDEMRSLAETVRLMGGWIQNDLNEYPIIEEDFYDLGHRFDETIGKMWSLKTRVLEFIEAGLE